MVSHHAKSITDYYYYYYNYCKDYFFKDCFYYCYYYCCIVGQLYAVVFAIAVFVVAMVKQL